MHFGFFARFPIKNAGMGDAHALGHFTLEEAARPADPPEGSGKSKALVFKRLWLDRFQADRPVWQEGRATMNWQQSEQMRSRRKSDLRLIAAVRSRLLEVHKEAIERMHGHNLRRTTARLLAVGRRRVRPILADQASAKG